MTKKTRKTKDIRLATAWMAFGATFEKSDRSDPRHQEFEFSTEEDGVEIASTNVPGKLYVTRGVDMDLIEKQLANRELLVNAADLLDAFQRMKSIIHSV